MVHDFEVDVVSDLSLLGVCGGSLYVPPQGIYVVVKGRGLLNSFFFFHSQSTHIYTSKSKTIFFFLILW
jgi:hypothetical protein